MPSKCINDGKTFNSAVDNLGIVCSNGEQEVYESRQCSGLMTSPGQEHCFVQHEESEHHSFSGFGEFCADKENLERNRELKRRKISNPNTDAVVGDRLLPASLIANPCSLKHAEKDDVELSTTERSRGSVTSRVLRSEKKRSRWITVFSSRDKAAKTVLSWLIENNVVLPRQKVAYVRRTDGLILKEGWITNDGIKCRCCLKIFSLSKFEAHNGTKTPSPSASIILQDGRSLLDCQKQIIFPLKPNELQHARFKSNFSNLEVDDVCSVCHDGGMLMICDLCPSAFHPTCIGLQDVPEGNWFCPSCRCEICGLSDYNFEDKDFIEKSGIYCDQCEREYHVGCLRKHGFPLRKRPTGAWTCSKSCSKIIDCLGQLLGKPNPTPVKGLSWTIVRNKRNYDGQLDEKTIVEDYGKLHIALDVLHECFEPLHETRTQSDVTADILFNRISRLNRLNFWGFYTMLLMKGEEVVCVATFRIFGEKLAEMPFICTRVKFRRQGMCRLLMDELQKLLSSLAVERLLLPAVQELLKTWTSSFWIHKDDIFRVVRTTKSHISHISWYSHVSQVLEEAIYFKLLINCC
ncbi:hypothetical protein HPP92_013786 [Vanilla planifolia]|uniref:PHD-type domain-containing protein n=1 Tax=Vanilla planifolia TaxID=51239 RepID=A0A835QP24_VANPL|nr:hypothetical protein HPP92_013786 [Vanilla planifolia]